MKIHFLAEKPELTMDFDPGKMTRIRANLLSNAINEPPGVYLIRVESEGGAVAIRRMVVVR